MQTNPTERDPMPTIDPDEELQRMFSELNFDEVVEENVKDLPNQELIVKFHETTQALLKRGEAMFAKSQEGRDLHSRRAAYSIEMRSRGLL